MEGECKIKDRKGEVGVNNFGTRMKIVRYKNYTDIDVEFLDEYHFIKEHTNYGNFSRGQVRNPYDRTVMDMAYLGVGKYITKDKNNKNSREYMCWKHMIERCYVEKHSNKHKSYYGICSICDEWLNFQNFAQWYEENKYDVNERLHLDKDILVPGNKLYSPNTCLLVPQRINMLFMNMPNKNGLPNGIRECKNGYSAKYNNKELGTYETVEEAFTIYALEKEKTIKRIADEYKDIIPIKVYDALYAYKVQITNDKNYVL